MLWQLLFVLMYDLASSEKSGNIHNMVLMYDLVFILIVDKKFIHALDTVLLLWTSLILSKIFSEFFLLLFILHNWSSVEYFDVLLYYAWMPFLNYVPCVILYWQNSIKVDTMKRHELPRHEVQQVNLPCPFALSPACYFCIQLSLCFRSFLAVIRLYAHYVIQNKRCVS